MIKLGIVSTCFAGTLRMGSYDERRFMVGSRMDTFLNGQVQQTSHNRLM